MGCGSSKNGNAALGEEELRRLIRELQETKLRASEQQNLLRFKIEVMVNMLAMEEKKNETSEKRLETLKWLLHEQGVKEQTLTNILLSAERDSLFNEEAALIANGEEPDREALLRQAQRSISFHNVGLVDLSGAMERVREEFRLFKDDIIPAFAEEDGKLVTTLQSEDFMKQLYTVTEKVSKADTQIIALRFGDGSGQVSVPEFLDYFTTAPHVRIARAATSAVRMSLDLLQLEAEIDSQEQQQQQQQLLLQDAGDRVEGEDDEGTTMDVTPKQVATHFSHNLERGTRRLLVLWLYVRSELRSHFAAAADNERSLVLELDVFKVALAEVCSEQSRLLRNLERRRKIFIINSTLGHEEPLPLPPATSTTTAAAEAKAKRTKAATGNSSKELENANPNIPEFSVAAPASLQLDGAQGGDKKPSRFSKQYRQQRSGGSSGGKDDREAQLQTVDISNNNNDDISGEASTSIKATKEVKAILAKVKQNVLEHSSGGGSGFSKLQRTFRSLDKDSSSTLLLQEFKDGFEDMRMDISEAEVELLFVYLDKNGNGSIAFNEFMDGLRGQLNERRLRLVEAAFRKLDVDKNGHLDEREIALKFDVSKHPQFLTGKMSAEEVREQFLEVLDVGRKQSGVVSREEFIDFYANAGAAVEDDDFFEDLVRDVWHIEDADLAAADEDSNDDDADEEAHEVEALEGYDIVMLTERFEVGGYVHYGRFLEYFEETHKVLLARGKKKHISLAATVNAGHAANPFRVSSEWHNLKSCSLLRQQGAQADAATLATAGTFNPSQTMSSITTNNTRPARLDPATATTAMGARNGTSPPQRTASSSAAAATATPTAVATSSTAVAPPATSASRFGFGKKPSTAGTAATQPAVAGADESPPKPNRFSFGRKPAATAGNTSTSADSQLATAAPPTAAAVSVEKQNRFSFARKSAPAAAADGNAATSAESPVKASSPQRFALFGKKRNPDADDTTAAAAGEVSPPAKTGGLFGRRKNPDPASPTDQSTGTPDHKRVTIQEPSGSRNSRGANNSNSNSPADVAAVEGKDDRSVADSKTADSDTADGAMDSGDVNAKKKGMFGWLTGKGKGTSKNQPEPTTTAAAADAKDSTGDRDQRSGNSSAGNVIGRADKEHSSGGKRDENKSDQQQQRSVPRTHSALSLSTDSEDTNYNLKEDREFRTPVHMSNSTSRAAGATTAAAVGFQPKAADRSNSKRSDSRDDDVMEDDNSSSSDDDRYSEQQQPQIVKRRAARAGSSNNNNNSSSRIGRRSSNESMTKTNSSYGFEDDSSGGNDGNGHNNSSYFEDFDDDEQSVPAAAVARRGIGGRKTTGKFR